MINFVIKSPKIKQIEVLKVAKKTTPKKTAKKAVAKKTAKKKTAVKKVAAKRQTKTKPATLSVNDVIIESILEKKGEKITSIDFKKIPDTAARYFIICEADSTTQVRAIAHNVTAKTKETLNEIAWHTEGIAQSEWVLIDYVSTVVHIFLKSKREFYQLEDLWCDAIVKEHNEL